MKSMVLFIGYQRSGHSLVGSLLDAHPNIIISDEMHVFRAWERFSKKTRDNLFQAMYTNSVQMATVGERTLSDCIPALGGYRYKVPNQWQGKFDRVIQVYLLHLITKCMHILLFFLSGTYRSERHVLSQWNTFTKSGGN